MAKTLEQIVIEGLAADCSSLEELYVLWQTMHYTETDTISNTSYMEIDKRSFHIDGVVNPEHFSGVLYILKEPSLKRYIQKGLAFPVITDVRRELRRYKKGYQDERGYVVGMQRLLLGETAEQMTNSQVMDTLGVVYVNKRGGKESSDDVWLNYGYQYIEFLKRQIRLIRPKVIVCGGEEIFKLVAKEVFYNKKSIRNRGEHMVWKDVVKNYQFTADASYRHTKNPAKTEIVVVNMWNPAYRVNKDQYISPEEYFKEFHRRIQGIGQASVGGTEPPR
ncbi:MAG: hypothetical protein Q4E86_06525 [Lachnospiraceae bacterium]|nr:hypothetical protein [Lachnospiraceae bacterium]